MKEKTWRKAELSVVFTEGKIRDWIKPCCSNGSDDGLSGCDLWEDQMNALQQEQVTPALTATMTFLLQELLLLQCQLVVHCPRLQQSTLLSAVLQTVSSTCRVVTGFQKYHCSNRSQKELPFMWMGYSWPPLGQLVRLNFGLIFWFSSWGRENQM